MQKPRPREVVPYFKDSQQARVESGIKCISLWVLGPFVLPILEVFLLLLKRIFLFLSNLIALLLENMAYVILILWIC